MPNKNETEMKELRGVECLVISEGRHVPCYVAHVDREKGITLYDFETDRKFFCYSKADFHRFLKYSARNRLYHVEFTKIVNAILHGDPIVCKSWNRRGEELEPSPFGTPITCAFE
jgi:hypothetical protein